MAVLLPPVAILIILSHHTHTSHILSPYAFFCFKGKPVVSLQAMPRPFKKLRELDMDKTAKDVVEAVKAAQKA